MWSNTLKKVLFMAGGLCFVGEYMPSICVHLILLKDQVLVCS